EALPYQVVAADSEVARRVTADAPAQRYDEDWLISGLRDRLARAGFKGARLDYTLSLWLRQLRLKVARVSELERSGSLVNGSLILERELIQALWANGERGQTADRLGRLRARVGAPLPQLELMQIRFWSQQDLESKARTLAQALLTTEPEKLSFRLALARLLQSKGWSEEACHLLDTVPNPDAAATDLRFLPAQATCYEATGRSKRAGLLQREVEARSPVTRVNLQRRYQRAIRHGEESAALEAAREAIKVWPQAHFGWTLLADFAEETEDAALMQEALTGWRVLAPLDAGSYREAGRWHSFRGESEASITAWRRALELDPEDEEIARRIAWIAPRGAEPWLADVPDEAALLALIEARDKVIPEAGTNVVYLLDDEVTYLRADGSTANVITLVAHAVNQEGRDALTRQRVRGRDAELLAAWAVNAAGERLEASSIRRQVVRYRQLDVGSTIVLQYRVDSESPPYLVGHLNRGWWFQGVRQMNKLSRWVLWLPKETKLFEEGSGPIEREERVETASGLRRVRWQIKDAPPVNSEPQMPPLSEVAWRLNVSTVPSWTTLYDWERELLRDAFRSSPEVEEVARELKLFDRSLSPREKVQEIYGYLLREIRYQQDYEGIIAGVRPHSAAQVVARQYGDCKDKAVLFIALAKLAGIKSHFALVRTRGAGPVEREVPGQNFNHAIVYVPEQEGLEGRFYDTTVDALDFSSLRHDDQGTLSLLFDPEKEQHYWKEIPYQAPTQEEIQFISRGQLDESGRFEGTVETRAQGRFAEVVRRFARNTDQFRKLMEFQVNQLFSGGELLEHSALEVESFFEPARAVATLQQESWASLEGQNLRLPNLISWSPKRLFALRERHHPLLLGIPSTIRWENEISLPPGAQLSLLPASTEVRGECLLLRREFERLPPESPKLVEGEALPEARGRLKLNWLFQNRCERLSVEGYQAHLPLARDMYKLLAEQVVVELARPTQREQSPQPQLPHQSEESGK
ncbi:MAG: transglutaminase domain-containing protein, partial [Myxococcota bacterium]|nr:transglutaminase domain-containing protein [Myxococcota bacterium]